LSPDEGLEGSGVDAFLGPEGPGEGPAPQCQLEAFGCGVQVRAPARCPAVGIGDGLTTGSAHVDDHTHQFLLGDPPTASDAGADWFSGHATNSHDLASVCRRPTVEQSTGSTALRRTGRIG
jgi:hypothetical protein